MEEHSSEALQRQVNELRTIFDASPLMFWYKDVEGVHVRVNRAAAALDGLPITAIEGKSHFDLYTPEQAEAFHTADQLVIKTGQPVLNIIEQHTSPVSREVQWLLTNKVPYQNEYGDIDGVIAFALDITQQVELEEAVAVGLRTLEELVQEEAGQAALLDFIATMRAEVERLSVRGGMTK